jgi:hypothetical protein
MIEGWEISNKKQVEEQFNVGIIAMVSEFIIGSSSRDKGAGYERKLVVRWLPQHEVPRIRALKRSARGHFNVCLHNFRYLTITYYTRRDLVMSWGYYSHLSIVTQNLKRWKILNSDGEYDLFVGCVDTKRGGDLRAGSVTDSSRPGCKTGNVLANTRSRLSQRLSTAL